MDRDSTLVGLVGSGIGPSLSPALHQREADELGIRHLYRRIDLDDLGRGPHMIGELVAATRLAGYDGLNVTHPGKQLVLGHLDWLSDDAAALGAVNTVVFGQDKSLGYNTDMSGFARGFGLGLPDADLDSIVLLGAGGAGAAVGHALLALGAGHIDVFDMDNQRAGALADALRSQHGPGRASALPLDDDTLTRALATADGLAHATPTGMAAHPGSPAPAESLRAGMWVADVVYRPLETELVRAARGRGCRVLDGGRMAVFQAADSFELFTGVEPDAARMSRHFDSLVARPAGRQDSHANG